MNDNAKEIICKNCKYHYIEEISFDYPQSCCSKRQITTEEWLKCNDFEYDDKYIEQLQRENKQLKEVINKAIEYIEKLNRIIPRFWFTKLLELLKEVE